MRNTSGIFKIVSLAWLAIVTLSACGGGASTESNQSSQSISTSIISDDASADVLAYKKYVWDNLSEKSRCGQCHYAGGPVPEFVHDKNIEEAHRAAQSFIGGVQVANQASPKDSLMVTIVRNGHKPQACWLATQDDCADAIEKFIQDWNDDTSGTTATPQGVKLVAPSPLRSVDESKAFPADSTAFESIVHAPVLTTHCARCHAGTEAPFFASNDVDASYLAAQQKMDLLDPANSRFVLRLRDESHNCWSASCADDADEMEKAIFDYAETIISTQIDQNLIVSKALKLQPPEAIIASGGERHALNQIALWEFKNAGGDPNANVAFDTSGINPLMPLTLYGDFDWVGGYGVRFRNGYAFAPNQISKKLKNNVLSRGEYSIEAWVIPSNVTQRDKNIISYSGSKTERNFTVSQYEYNYQFQNRSNESDLNGDPLIETKDGSQNLQSAQQHIVMTYDSIRGGRIYVNGVLTDHDPDVSGNNGTDGDLSNWDNKLVFMLANEVGVSDLSRSWDGTFRMVAIHNRVLSDEQIQQNFKAGVGEKFFLLFSISHIAGVPADSYIKVQAEQFDTYSYLFNNPVYVNLGNPELAIDFPIAGMRIGINGKEAIVGQSFINLTSDGTDLRVTANNQEISRLGSVIQLQQGTIVDDFFLTFEVLGTETNSFVVAKPDPNNQPAPVDLPAQSDIGVRTFSEINGMMSELTGVPTSNSAVFATYNSVIQQLPSTEDINAFVPANIIGISQMAFEYCDQLVENNPNIPTVCERDPAATSARQCMFDTFDFSLAAATAFNVAGTGRADIADALYDRMIGISRSGVVLNNAPTRTQITDELITTTASGRYPGNLVDRLIGASSSTKDITKAMCTTVLGSAAMLIQ